MKAEERAREVVGQLNAIIDMGEAIEVVAGAISVAQREEGKATIERCAEALDERANLLFRSAQSAIDPDSPAYDPDNVPSLMAQSHGSVAAAKWLRALPSLYKEAS